MADINLITLTLTLFLIMDPIGNIGALLQLTQSLDKNRAKWVILREMLIALATIFLFHYLGEFIFSFLDLSEIAVRLSSGVILFLVSLRILFPGATYIRGHLPPGEPFIIPLAIPLIAGPSLLATVMLYSHMETCQPMMLTAILISWMASAVILMIAPWLNRFLGKNGLSACERLLAMVLVILAIQRFLDGITQFLKDAAH